MRQFAGSGFRIWRLSREAKVIYTFFCVLSLLAVASSIALYEDLVGPSLRRGHLDRVRSYYVEGSQAAVPSPAPAEAEPPSPAGSGGPAIALAEEERAPTLTVAMPLRKLLEVTHFHLFTVPVFLLILTHLFMLTGASGRQKMIWISLGWGAGSLHIGAPWLIRFGGGSLGWLFPLSGALLAVSSLVLTVYPVIVMWRRPRRRHKRGHEHGAHPPGSAEPGAPAAPHPSEAHHEDEEYAPPMSD